MSAPPPKVIGYPDPNPWGGKAKAAGFPYNDRVQNSFFDCARFVAIGLSHHVCRTRMVDPPLLLYIYGR